MILDFLNRASTFVFRDEVSSILVNEISLPCVDAHRREFEDGNTVDLSHIESLGSTSDQNFHKSAVGTQVRIESLDESSNNLAESVDNVGVDIDGEWTVVLDIQEWVSLEVFSEAKLSGEADIKEIIEGLDFFAMSVLNNSVTVGSAVLAGSNSSDDSFNEGNSNNKSILIFSIGVSTDHGIEEFTVSDLVVLSESQNNVVSSANAEFSVVSSLKILVLELVSQGVVEECFKEWMSVEAELSHLVDGNLARSPSVQSAPERLDTKSIQIDTAVVSTIIFARESQVSAVDSVREERSNTDTRVVRNFSGNLGLSSGNDEITSRRFRLEWILSQEGGWDGRDIELQVRHV